MIVEKFYVKSLEVSCSLSFPWSLYFLFPTLLSLSLSLSPSLSLSLSPSLPLSLSLPLPLSFSLFLSLPLSLYLPLFRQPLLCCIANATAAPLLSILAFRNAKKRAHAHDRVHFGRGSNGCGGLLCPRTLFHQPAGRRQYFYCIFACKSGRVLV